MFLWFVLCCWDFGVYFCSVLLVFDFCLSLFGTFAFETWFILGVSLVCFALFGFLGSFLLMNFWFSLFGGFCF